MKLKWRDISYVLLKREVYNRYRVLLQLTVLNVPPSPDDDRRSLIFAPTIFYRKLRILSRVFVLNRSEFTVITVPTLRDDISYLRSHS